MRLSETRVENFRIKLWIHFVFMVTIFPHYMRANIADFDEVWQQRAKIARTVVRKAYQPHPEKVTQNFNYHVNKYTSPYLIITFYARIIIFLKLFSLSSFTSKNFQII